MKGVTQALAIALTLPLAIVGCCGGKILTPEDATRALTGRTFEFKDDTGLPYGIPVDLNRLTFSADGNTCSLSSRPVTRDEFREIHEGEVVVNVKRYINTGEAYIQLKCGEKGYTYIVVSAKKLDVYAFGQDEPFSSAFRL